MKNNIKIIQFLKFIFSNDFLLKIMYILTIISLFNLLTDNLEINIDTYMRGYVDNQLTGDIDVDVNEGGILHSIR